MTTAIERTIHHPCNVARTPLGWRLLARLAALVRRPATIDPEQLTPHLLRDLGLPDDGFRSQPGTRAPLDWPLR